MPTPLKRRIKKANVSFISLVPKGANQMPVFYKSDEAGEGTNFQVQTLTKEGADFDEKGELLSVVYAPDTVDSQGDAASATVIKEMMQEAAINGLPQVDIRHDFQALDRKTGAAIVESFEIQKGDTRFSDFQDVNGNSVDVSGGWGVVIKIFDEDLKQKYRDGEWGGVSMAGTAIFDEITKEDGMLATSLQELATMLGLRDPYAYQNITLSGDIDMSTMSKEDRTSFAKEIASAVAEAIKPATHKEQDPALVAKQEEATEEVLFKGDPTSQADIEKHLAKIQAGQIDWSDPEAVKSHLQKMKDEQSGITKEAGVKETDSPEIAQAKITLHKAELAKQHQEDTGSAQQVSSDVNPNTQTTIQKEHDSAVEEILGFVNGNVA